MARWRTWDLECLEETLVTRPSENKFEPIIVAGCTREIKHISLSSIVLPREALFSTSDEGKSGKKSRGRGRALATRALGFDKPSRRPGERDSSEKASPKPTPRSQLGSQFLGSEYLYDEVFPSLDQSMKNTDPKSSIPTKSAWSSKQKKERPSQKRPVWIAEQTSNIKGSFLEESKDKSISDQADDPDTRNKDQLRAPFSTFYDSVNDAGNYDKHKTHNSDMTLEQNDWYSDEIESGTTGKKAQCFIFDNSSDSRNIKASEEFNQDKQYIFSQPTDKAALEDYQNSINPKEDNFQEENWIESEEENNEKWQNDDWISDKNDNETVCDKIKQIHTAEYNNCTEDWIESDEKDNEQCQNDDWISDENDNETVCDKIKQIHTAEYNNCTKDWIESDEKDKEQCQNNDWISHENDNETVCDKTKQIENFDGHTAEYNSHNNCTDLTTDEQYATNDHSSPMQDTFNNTEFAQDNTNISLSTNYLFSHSTNFEDSELEKHIETKDTQEIIEDPLDMSTTSEEMEPCNVLLENLPLALTEEELQDIVEPYGEMVSSNFEEKDERSKTCVVRMGNSMSGELLVVSLDGLEVDGYRIKVTMDDS